MPAPWQPPDLDEIHPDRFIVNNEKVRALLRGEGDRQGLHFELQTTRRDGWVARVRAAGFNIRTLDDRLAALPGISADQHAGPEGFRPLATARERIATWNREKLNWSELPVVNEGSELGVRLHANEPLRRRRGRGAADHFVAMLERSGRIGLRPVGETDALLHAYALMASSEHPVELRVVDVPGGYHVPAGSTLFPLRHRETLGLLVDDDAPAWTFQAAQRQRVEQVFEKLGIRLHI